MTAREIELEDRGRELACGLNVGAASLSEEHRWLHGGVTQLFTYQLIDRALRSTHFAVP